MSFLLIHGDNGNRTVEEEKGGR